MKKVVLCTWALLCAAMVLAAQVTQPTDAGVTPGAIAAPPATSAPGAPEKKETPASAAPNGNSSGTQAEATSSENIALDPDDPLLKTPPLPPGRPTLIGGQIERIDKIRETVTVAPFGGGKMKIYFDERSRFFRDGAETTMLGMRKGDRVYLDTMLVGSKVFAKNVRVETHGLAANAEGQVIGFDAKHSRLEVRDELTAQPVTFLLTPETVIARKSQAESEHELAQATAAAPTAQSHATRDDLLPGSLVSVRFSADASGAERGVAREVDIHASPGSSYVFAGTVTYLNLANGVLGLQNTVDNRNYEIHFAPDMKGIAAANLAEGKSLTLSAMFDGRRYMLNKIMNGDH